jgi:hypothetical protein
MTRRSQWPTGRLLHGGISLADLVDELDEWSQRGRWLKPRSVETNLDLSLDVTDGFGIGIDFDVRSSCSVVIEPLREHLPERDDILLAVLWSAVSLLTAIISQPILDGTTTYAGDT